MDLKEFITETITGIVEATSELQRKYETEGVIINPPVSAQERDLYEEGGSSHLYRRVETVEFDVAVTAGSETGAGGKAGIRILSVEAGAEGKHTAKNESVSRVKFSVPLALHPSKAERENKAANESGRESLKRSMENFEPRKIL